MKKKNCMISWENVLFSLVRMGRVHPVEYFFFSHLLTTTLAHYHTCLLPHFFTLTYSHTGTLTHWHTRIQAHSHPSTLTCTKTLAYTHLQTVSHIYLLTHFTLSHPNTCTLIYAIAQQILLP